MMPEDKNIFAYYRVLENKRWLVVVNMTDRQIESDQVKDLIKDYRSVILHNYKSKEISATLAPYEAYIVQK